MSIIKHVALQRIVAHDFRYDRRSMYQHASNSTSAVASNAGNVLIALLTMEKYELCNSRQVGSVLVDMMSVK